MEPFLHGAAAATCGFIGLFFLRFWRQSGDGLFRSFALAFLILAAERSVLGTWPQATEWREYVYLLRLLAFGLIIHGIITKNRT